MTSSPVYHHAMCSHRVTSSCWPWANQHLEPRSLERGGEGKSWCLGLKIRETYPIDFNKIPEIRPEMWYCLTSYPFQFVFILVASIHLDILHKSRRKKNESLSSVSSLSKEQIERTRRYYPGHVFLPMGPWRQQPQQQGDLLFWASKCGLRNYQLHRTPHKKTSVGNEWISKAKPNKDIFCQHHSSQRRDLLRKLFPTANR